MKQVVGAVTALSLFLQTAPPVWAGGSTINTSVPAQGAPLQSAPIRNNFVAAATDINNLMSMFAGNSAPASPVTFQLWANPSVNPAPIKIFDGTQFVLTGTLDRITHAYSPALGPSSIAGQPPITAAFSGTTATVGITLDSNFTVTGGALALNPIPAGQMLANCTNGTAEPTQCNWNAFANQAISSTNGALPYRTGGVWGTIFTGTSGGTIPLNNTANVFSQLQATNLNASALPSPQAGAIGQWQQADSVIGRLEIDTTGQPAVVTGLRADGTAASPTGLVANDEILSLNAWGYDGTSRGASGGAGRISIFAGGTWSNTSHPTYIDFGTTAASTVTLTSRGHIENDGGLTWPSTVTGGSKGAGTINAQGVFINGAALSAAAANLTVGTSAIASGTTTRVLFDNAGLLGEYSISGTGNVAMTTSPAFTTPALGAATGTSLALNGATIAGNALAVTGTTALGGALTVTSNAAAAAAVGPNGTTNPVWQIDASTASQVAGFKLTGAATGGTVALVVTDSGANANLSVNAKGTGTTSIANVSTGSLSLGAGGGGVSVASALTYAGVTFNNTVTGTGNLVGSASPTFSGTVAGNFTLSGNLTLSGNDTFSGQAIHTGTSAPASAAGNTVVLGTLAAVPTLTNTGQAFVFNTTAGGAVLQGDGSSDDIRIYNKSAGLILNVPTGTTVPQLPGLASGTCVNGLALDSSNNVVKASCPGSASSIQVTGTSVTSANGTNRLLTEGTVTAGTGTLADTPATADSSGNLAAVNSIAGNVVATKAQQQSGTSSTNVVTPGQQQSHDSAAKAWSNVTNSAGSYTLNTSYNVASLAKNATGDVSLTLTTAFVTDTTHMNCVATVNDLTFAGTPTVSLVDTTHIRIQIWSIGSTPALTNDSFSVQCFGRQ